MKNMGLSFKNMQSKEKALEELAQMTIAVYLVRVLSQMAGEEIDHCFWINAERRIILDGAESFEVRLNKRAIRLCGMNKNGVHDAEVLMNA